MYKLHIYGHGDLPFMQITCCTQLQNSVKIWHFPDIKHIISAVYSIAVSLCNSVMIPSNTVCPCYSQAQCHADYCSVDMSSSTDYLPHAFPAMVIVQTFSYYILVTAKSCDKEAKKLFSPAASLV